MSKWVGQKHERLDLIYRELLRLEERAKGPEPVYVGPLSSAPLLYPPASSKPPKTADFQDHPSGKRFPRALDFHWQADQGTAHIALRQPHLIDSFSLLDDFSGWKRWLARRFVNPYYFRFNAEIELNVDLAETKAMERGSSICELMTLR